MLLLELRGLRTRMGLPLLVFYAPPPNPVFTLWSKSHLSLNLEGLGKTVPRQLDPFPITPSGSGGEALSPRSAGIRPILCSSGPPFCRLVPPTILLPYIPLAQCLVPKRGSQVSYLSVGGLCYVPEPHSVWRTVLTKRRVD